MSNTKSKNPMVYDIRVIQRNVGDGTVSPEDVKAHLAGLPDVAAKGEPFETTLRGFEREDEEEASDDQE
jgi:hypothetical protein